MTPEEMGVAFYDPPRAGLVRADVGIRPYNEEVLLWQLW